MRPIPDPYPIGALFLIDPPETLELWLREKTRLFRKLPENTAGLKEGAGEPRSNRIGDKAGELAPLIAAWRVGKLATAKGAETN
jgi:hypothetical protein